MILYPPARVMPPCKNCLHRRIRHFKGTQGSRKGQMAEVPMRCSMPFCGCDNYEPWDEGWQVLPSEAT